MFVISSSSSSSAEDKSIWPEINSEKCMNSEALNSDDFLSIIVNEFEVLLIL
ncbi:Uncharacterised protein [Providencia rettgeri]|nr:Uncharacterised protein [Providencia rettgeri]